MSRQKPSRRSMPQSGVTPKTFGELFPDAPSKVTAAVVGARIVAARKRRSKNQSDLAKATKLSRSVINGYEKGRHLPGARELALICDALTTSPNELLYGVADPFAGQASELKLDAATTKGVTAALMIHKLEQNERDAVLTLVRSLVEFRHGKQASEFLSEMGPVLIEQLKHALPKLERDLAKSRAIPPMQSLIERMATTEKQAGGELPRKPSPRRSARRSR